MEKQNICSMQRENCMFSVYLSKKKTALFKSAYITTKGEQRSGSPPREKLSRPFATHNIPRQIDPHSFVVRHIAEPVLL